jgi:regulation of enolase protein 1 (concanavalin A-like superfamily)
MEWYNAPQAWRSEGDRIEVTAAGKTDFWRLTRSGAIRDNGHFYYARQSTDFVCEVRLSGKYAAQYDQAGLMVRADEANWLKCGIELVDGVQHASAVLTRDYSDWSVVPLPQPPPAIWLRVSVNGSTIQVHYSLDGVRYVLLRLSHLARAETVSAGIMCAAPQGPGFPATFTGLAIRPA